MMSLILSVLSACLRINYDSFKYDKSLKGEFVRLVQSQDMDEDEKAKIIEIGIRAIMGEEI